MSNLCGNVCALPMFKEKKIMTKPLSGAQHALNASKLFIFKASACQDPIDTTTNFKAGSE